MRPTQENDVFHAIAHPARRAMLVALVEGEHTASALAEPFQMTFGAVSQHLRVLEQAELVEVRRAGRLRLYRLRAEPLGEVATWVGEFARYFEERLDALGDYLDRKHGQPPTPPPKRLRARRR